MADLFGYFCLFHSRQPAQWCIRFHTPLWARIYGKNAFRQIAFLAFFARDEKTEWAEARWGSQCFACANVASGKGSQVRVAFCFPARAFLRLYVRLFVLAHELVRQVANPKNESSIPMVALQCPDFSPHVRSEIALIIENASYKKSRAVFMHCLGRMSVATKAALKPVADVRAEYGYNPYRSVFYAAI